MSEKIKKKKCGGRKKNPSKKKGSFFKNITSGDHLRECSAKKGVKTKERKFE